MHASRLNFKACHVAIWNGPNVAVGISSDDERRAIDMALAQLFMQCSKQRTRHKKNIKKSKKKLNLRDIKRNQTNKKHKLTEIFPNDNR